MMEGREETQGKCDSGGLSLRMKKGVSEGMRSLCGERQEG